MEPNPSNIKGFVFDIDGVLTDGSMICLGDGDLLRTVNAKDCTAMRIAADKGYVTGIISGGDTEALSKRCRRSGVLPENTFLGCRGKMPYFLKFCEQNGLTPREVAYFGDDLADIPLLRLSGLGIVPQDASPEAKEAADYICSNPGGHCAAREGIELVLKARGDWKFDENYTSVY